MQTYRSLKMSDGTIGDLPWYPIIISTIVAGTAVGLLFHFQLYILSLFGSIIGIPSLVGGAILHGVGTAVFVTVFASLLTRTRVMDVVTSTLRILLAGLTYGVLVFGVMFGVVLPIVTLIRPVRALGMPYLPLDALLIHLVFGLLLGLAFALTWRPDPQRR